MLAETGTAVLAFSCPEQYQPNMCPIERSYEANKKNKRNPPTAFHFDLLQLQYSRSFVLP